MKPNASAYHRAFCFIHWTLALLVSFLYATGYYRLMFTAQTKPLSWYLLVWHMNAGVLVVAFTLLAFLAKLIFPVPTEKAPDLFINVTTKIVHLGLYAMLLAIPCAAYIGLGFDFPLVGLIKVPGIIRFVWIHQWVREHLHMPLITFMEPFAQFHRDTGADIILPVFMGLHIGAALYHHFVLQDTVLIRMFPLLKRQSTETQKRRS